MYVVLVRNPSRQLSPAQKLEFLGSLISGSPLPVVKLEAMQSLYELDQTDNVELSFRWIRLGLKVTDWSAPWQGYYLEP